MAASSLPEVIDNVYLFSVALINKDNKVGHVVNLAMDTMGVQKLDHHCIFPIVGTNSCRQPQLP